MTLRVTVTRAWHETPEIRCFELAAADGAALPAFEPGAHIDVRLSDRLVRQYSLLNGPADCGRYLIGVKREPQSRGGSVAMHGLAEGDQIEIGGPRNNFPLARQAGDSLLLAGGIGVTPLLSMARHLSAAGRRRQLHLFARSLNLAPFRNELVDDPDAFIHPGLVPPQLDRTLEQLVASQPPDAHLYICGPTPFMELAKRIAADAGWADSRVHLEYFAGPETPQSAADGAFEVVLQRTGRSLTVREDQTIIEAMAEAGIDILTSCEQGVCGTCVTTVLEGEPDHRDLYFNAAEHASGKVITPCVSRCKGKRLVLDL